MLRFVIVGLLLFLLPHADRIPVKLAGSPRNFPVGMGNIIAFLGLAAWMIGRNAGDNVRNTIRAYALFLAVVIAGVAVAMITGFQSDSFEILKAGKEQIFLMFLYFIPLAAIKNQDDFRKVFLLLLFVHFIIGFEVMRSGVLEGSAFHDGKRGSGPFGFMYRGSDVAASYLAQFIMFFLAVLLMHGIPVVRKGIAALGGVVMFLGILATYSRGALIAVVAGVFAMFFVQGIKLRSVFIALLIGIVGLVLIPPSTLTRVTATVNEEGELDRSSQGRFEYFASAIAIARDYPLGVGTGQVRLAMKQYLPVVREREEEEGIAVDPHNGFLHALCENGVLGLALFIWLLLKLLLVSRKAYRDGSLPLEYRTYALGMVGFLGSLVVCNMLYSNFFKGLVIGTVVFQFGVLAYINAKMEPILPYGPSGEPSPDSFHEES